MDKETLFIVLTVFIVKSFVVGSCRSPKEGEYLGQPELARIVGSIFVKPNQIPYQVRVRIHTNSTVWKCGGSIISRRYVLTVAHCFRKKAIKRIEVVAGVVDMTNRGLISLNVTDKILHEKRPDQNIANDIALLKVARPFPAGLPNVKAIRLREDTGFFSTWCTASGWGEAYDDTDPDMLRLIHIPLTTKAICDKTYGARDDVICAGWLKQGGKDTCQGDSGGPLVCDGLLTGIIKAGKGCAKPDYPGTYTEVAYYSPWIKKILAENREDYSDGDIQYYGEDDTDPDMLRLIHIPLTTKAICDKTYGARDDVICAGWLKQGGKDTCQGDSGGPLVCDGLLTGIIKAGKGCAKPDYPGTYTEVAYYSPWIKKILAENREDYSDGDIQYYGEVDNSEIDRKCDEGSDVSSFHLAFSHSGDYSKVTMTF